MKERGSCGVKDLPTTVKMSCHKRHDDQDKVVHTKRNQWRISSPEEGEKTAPRGLRRRKSRQGHAQGKLRRGGVVVGNK